MVLTIDTTTGIKRFVEEKGFSKCFDALFLLIKSRDSCQPKLAIEPSGISGPSTPNTLTAELFDVFDDPAGDEGANKAMFVSSRKRKRKDAESSSSDNVLKLLGKMIKNDPTKELLKFMKEDAEKSRQHELRLLQCLAGQSHGVFVHQEYNYNSVVPQPMQQQPMQFQYHATSWPNLEPQKPQGRSVPQTSPHDYNPEGNFNSPFRR